MNKAAPAAFLFARTSVSSVQITDMKITSLITGAIIFSLTANAQVDSTARRDTVMYQRDSAIADNQDPTVTYFQQGEKAKDPGKIILLTKTGKTKTLQAFLSNPDMMYPDYVFDDIDSDGKKELLITSYTGGAHCCDELYFFKNIGPGKYQQTAKLFGGHTLVTPKKQFVYTFVEQFGYFFTCYACGYVDTTDEAPIDMHAITIRYNKGKLLVVPGDKELRSILLDNLGKLSEQPYEVIDEDLGQDNGLRKEFAMNLAVFYYSFGKNLTETKALFNRFYKFADARKVWTAFSTQIQYMKKDNDF